jgi:hypothetical protein
VGIVTGYGFDDKGVEVEVPVRSRFFHLQIVQTGSGVYLTSSPMGTWGSFPRVKWPGREADHSTSASSEVKKMWIYASTPPYVFMA